MHLYSRLAPFVGIFGALTFAAGLSAAEKKDENSFRLHNGWQITPVGTHENVGDMLLGCALSPDAKTLALTNVGYGTHQLQIVNVASGKVRQTLPLGRGWNGIAWRGDETIYVSGGASPFIHVFQKSFGGKFVAALDFRLPGLSADPKDEPNTKQAYISGLAYDEARKTLYAANLATDEVFALDVTTGSIKARRSLTAGGRPYCVRLGADGVYISQLAEGNILVLDSASLETKRTLATGSHPNDFLFAPDGRLFVSCGNDDKVLVLDAQSGAINERISTALTPNALPGATPDAIAITPDGKTLFAANADNNAVCVVDVETAGQSHVRGFIPTGWYPTALSVAPDGKRLFIGSGKGLGTRANPVKKLPINNIVPRDFEYIGKMLSGLISTVILPDEARLAAYTKQVYANTPYNDSLIEKPTQAPPAGQSAIPSRLGDSSPIKHILYVIKENRTYDQVFGDFKDNNRQPRGNGDPNLTLFGEEITPNQHELARQYVLLDNTYCNGEVSADGHPWSTAAIVTDIVQKLWPPSYGGKGPSPLNEKVAVPPSGYIWDACARKGLLYRSYGEQVFASSADAPPSALASSDGVTGLRGHASKAWQDAKGRRDYEKADVFINELKEFERNDNLPNFMVMSLGENHTQGTKAGAFTPKAAVASNDLGLGKIVEACSRSKYWKEMAIFVIEDDAQNGPDHVDAHRTAALVISPYVKRRHLDSTFYTTTSLLRSMELILGLPPLSQYDAASTPLYNSFGSTPDLTSYTALPARHNLQEKNQALAYGAGSSSKLDFSGYDHLTVADEDVLNRVLWHSIKGENVPYPGINRRAIFSHEGRSLAKPHEESEEDEDEERESKKPVAKDDD